MINDNVLDDCCGYAINVSVGVQGIVKYPLVHFTVLLHINVGRHSTRQSSRALPTASINDEYKVDAYVVFLYIYRL